MFIPNSAASVLKIVIMVLKNSKKEAHVVVYVLKIHVK